MTTKRTAGSSGKEPGCHKSARSVEQVYERLAHELWALLYAQCCDAERAYDALHEAFLRLQEQNGTPIRDERAWLLRVGRNWLRDVARRQRVAARSVPHLDHVPDSRAEPSSTVADDELHSRVRKGLTQLTSNDREVLVLRYSLGWSSARIAMVLDSTATAVDMRLSRARRRLADLLEQNGAGHAKISTRRAASS